MLRRLKGEEDSLLDGREVGSEPRLWRRLLGRVRGERSRIRDAETNAGGLVGSSGEMV